VIDQATAVNDGKPASDAQPRDAGIVGYFAEMRAERMHRVLLGFRRSFRSGSTVDGGQLAKFQNIGKGRSRFGG